MTDMDKWKEFLKGYGVGFEEAPCETGFTLTLTAKKDAKVIGYTAFEAVVYFTPMGQFMEIGVWE